jgi:hypothetical protein
MSGSSFAFRPSGSIEFEAVDPAALVQPQPEAVPADDGIDRDALSANFGRRKDNKVTSTDRMLSGVAIEWFIALAAGVRPKALCEHFPHVANRLSVQWADRARYQATLEQLIADPRWGTAGYPGQVQGELRLLLSQR